MTGVLNYRMSLPGQLLRFRLRGRLCRAVEEVKGWAGGEFYFALPRNLLHNIGEGKDGNKS